MPCDQEKLERTAKSKAIRIKFDWWNAVASGGGGYLANELVFDGAGPIPGIEHIPLAGHYITSGILALLWHRVDLLRL